MPRTKETTVTAAVKKPRAPRASKVKSAAAVATPAPIISVQESVPTASTLEYITAVGRRKAATAFVKLYHGGTGEFIINGKTLPIFFSVQKLRDLIMRPLELTGVKNTLNIVARISGGGIKGQAESLALAISRALTKLNAAFRPTLRGIGLLTVDARVKERKKPGLKRARRAPQWQKR